MRHNCSLINCYAVCNDKQNVPELVFASAMRYYKTPKCTIFIHNSQKFYGTKLFLTLCDLYVPCILFVQLDKLT